MEPTRKSMCGACPVRNHNTIGLLLNIDTIKPRLHTARLRIGTELFKSVHIRSSLAHWEVTEVNCPGRLRIDNARHVGYHWFIINPLHGWGNAYLQFGYDGRMNWDSVSLIIKLISYEIRAGVPCFYMVILLLLPEYCLISVKQSRKI